MAYGLVLTVACVVLTFRHVIDPTVSVRSRVFVLALTVASFLLAERGLSSYIMAILLQLALSLTLLLRQIARAA
jgi:hypothetical protein